MVRAHRTARFVLTVTNRGNTALDVALSAVDPERSIRWSLEPARLVVPAASAADVLVSVRGPRMLIGSEIDRPITITASARRAQPPHPQPGRADRAVAGAADPMPHDAGVDVPDPDGRRRPGTA